MRSDVDKRNVKTADAFFFVRLCVEYYAWCTFRCLSIIQNLLTRLLGFVSISVISI